MAEEKESRNDWPEQKPLVMYRLDECDKQHEEHRQEIEKVHSRITGTEKRVNDLSEKLVKIIATVGTGVSIVVFLAEKVWDKFAK